MSNIAPFGKYKGKLLEEMLADKSYCEWVKNQPWFKSQHLNIYNVIINNSIESTKSPEHNRLQNLFLSNDFCSKFIMRLYDVTDVVILDKLFEPEVSKESKSDPRRTTYVTTYVDVGLKIECALKNDYKQWRKIAIECKPTLGDDYPIVLRKLNGYSTSRYLALLIGEFKSEATTIEQLKEIFKLSDIDVILLDEI